MWKAHFKVYHVANFYVLIVRFHFKRDVSEARGENVFEKNISKYLKIFST